MTDAEIEAKILALLNARTKELSDIKEKAARQAVIDKYAAEINPLRAQLSPENINYHADK